MAIRGSSSSHPRSERHQPDIFHPKPPVSIEHFLYIYICRALGYLGLEEEEEERSWFPEVERFIVWRENITGRQSKCQKAYMQLLQGSKGTWWGGEVSTAIIEVRWGDSG